MSKPDLRRQLRANLDQLSFPDLIAKSGDLSQRFREWAQIFQAPPHLKKTLVSFYPFGNEPQIQVEPTNPSEAVGVSYEIAYLRIENWAAREMLPRVARRDLPEQWEEFDLPGGNRIFQPTGSQPACPPATIAGILVPGLGFTLAGDRLGRGAGFYDRFLAQVPTALRIGIAFEIQIMEILPSSDHDLQVDIILTESRLIETNRYSQWKKHARIERE